MVSGIKKLELRGTFILKTKGILYKVLSVKPCGHNEYAFDCRDIQTKKPESLKSKNMKTQDIFLLDIDDGGIWKLVPGEYIKKLEKDFKTA